MTGIALAVRGAHIFLRPRTAPSFARRRTLVRLRRMRRSYWDYQIRRATYAALRDLDDRTLAEIGIERNEIEAFVHQASAGSRPQHHAS